MDIISTPANGEWVLKDGDDADPIETVEKSLKTLTDTVDERLKAVETKSADTAKIGERLDKIETKLARPNLAKGGDEDEKAALERKAFDRYARDGKEGMEAEERKALTVADDQAGGYLAPETFGDEILKTIREYSPIRQYARVITIGSTSIKYPKRTSPMSAYWVDEVEDRTETGLQYSQIELTPKGLATFVDVSQQLLEDNSYNLESELGIEFGEAFGKEESVAFVTGDGVKQPNGLMNAAGISEYKTGSASGFGTNPADKLIGMFHALPSVHAQRGTWVMNRNTLGTVRTWKDGNGRYLLTEPVTEGAAATLLGRPIAEAVDMPDVAADAFPIIFGDLQGYRIVDRVRLSILRDPYSIASKGQVRFHGRRRVTGDVTHPDRFIKLKVATNS